MKTYLDNAATTKVSEEVIKAMAPYFDEKYGNPSSLHSCGKEAKKAVEDARKIIAESINAEPEEIIFTSGGTESDNTAIKEIAFRDKKKNHIITSKIEHPAVLETCRFLEKTGFRITYLDVDKDGLIDLKLLEKAITKKTILVSIMHANNEIGTIQDIENIGKICKKHNVLFHTDAVQSYTKEKIDVKKQDIDLMSLSAHKIHGPKGVGALYIKKGIKIVSLLHGGGHEFDLRSGTENVTGIVGFAEAVKISNKSDIKKMARLREYAIKKLLKIPETNLNGHRTKRLCNNISVCFESIEGEALLMYLDSKQIYASTGSACSSKKLEPSHVLTAIGLQPEKAHGSLRLSLSKYTTKKEIDYALEYIETAVSALRKISPTWKK